MTDDARMHLHKNTAKWLGQVTERVIQVGYLVQVYCIAPEYARGVFDLLPEPRKFGFGEVEAASEGAEGVKKEMRFRPSALEDRLVGFAPSGVVYGA